MSRIGRLPVPIPEGVTVSLEGNVIRVKGPKGELVRELHRDIKVEVVGQEVRVSRPGDDGFYRALHGLTRSLIANMVEGVTKGFQRNLEIAGVGYRAAKEGKTLVLSMGYSHPVRVEPAPGIEFEVPSPTRLAVKGSDKQLVGQTAAQIRAIRAPEPYLGKGIRYEGEVIRRKAGKAGKAGKK
ncbi:MAG: 50S ribosomal protein L6 [Bacillota bacterium]|nr:50S ribosomal protein L6 [Bacillota bacterium]